MDKYKVKVNPRAIRESDTFTKILQIPIYQVTKLVMDAGYVLRGKLCTIG